MIKKLLLIPLMGVISFGAFASADSIDISYFNSSFSPSSITLTNNLDNSNTSFSNSSCSAVGDWGMCCIKINETEIQKFNSMNDLNFQAVPVVHAGTYNLSSCSNGVPFDFITLTSDSIYNPIPDTPETPDDGDSSYVPGIPDSFTSGLTNLLTNFGSTIVSWLPIIILAALGIYAIFAVFRVIRNYARSSFNG